MTAVSRPHHATHQVCKAVEQRNEVVLSPTRLSTNEEAELHQAAAATQGALEEDSWQTGVAPKALLSNAEVPYPLPREPPQAHAQVEAPRAELELQEVMAFDSASEEEIEESSPLAVESGANVQVESRACHRLISRAPHRRPLIQHCLLLLPCQAFLSYPFVI